MPRPAETETEAINADSFLDIVASVVSIMIVMVLMVGLRIKNTPVDLAAAGLETKADGQLTADLALEGSLRRDVLQAAAEVRQVQQAVAVRGRQRDAIALAVSLLERKAEAPGQSPPADTPQDRALRNDLSAARLELDETNRQRIAVETAPADVVQVANYPTPLSRTVDGPELQFQLRGGRLAAIPLDRLLEKLRSGMKYQMYKLEDRTEFTETVGPEGGFCLRYTMMRKNFTPEEVREHHSTGFYGRLKRYTLVPVSENLGEPVEDALKENSQLRRVLAEHAGEHPTITIWTYPEGFAAFRRLKEELHRLGFATAGRPLPPDTPIGASLEGTKSAAE
jgi:hypothetical protein